MTQQKKPGLETLCGLIAAILAVLGLGLYILGFSTGYYIFGQMQSTLTVILICSAIVLTEPLTPAGIVGAVLIIGSSIVSEVLTQRGAS